MSTLRELKGRIGSVASTEKITGAMKMISSAKMHKAEGIVRRLSPYRDCINTIIASLLSSEAPVSSPLMLAREKVRTATVVVFGSDDGLCGAYNVNIFKGMLDTLARLRADYGSDIAINVLTVGKKMAKAARRIAEDDKSLTISSPQDIDSRSEGDDVKAFARTLTDSFIAGHTDRVELVYMHYFSAGRQRLTTDGYLPIAPDSLDADAKHTKGHPCIFEPDAVTIFATVLPMYLLSQLQEAFAQNRASEQAARVMAMQSANDNAHKLLDQLQLEYNKLRQQSITTELLDIVGGQARD